MKNRKGPHSRNEEKKRTNRGKVTMDVARGHSGLWAKDEITHTIQITNSAKLDKCVL